MVDHRAVQIVFVEVPSAGSPKSLREVKPLPFQRNPPTHWRPQRTIPSKAAASKRLLDNFLRQDQIVREFMRPDAAMGVERKNRVAGIEG
jgi:hypothetical protein